MIELSLIKLQPFDLSKSSALFKLIDNNRLYLRRWLNWLDFTNCEKDSFNFIQKCLHSDKQNLTLNYFVTYKNEIIGTIALTKINKNEAEIGYWLSENMRGNSITTYALKQLIEITKTKNLTKKLIIKCLPENHASIAVAKKASFTYDEKTNSTIELYGKTRTLQHYQLCLYKLH